jgi:hypothetical protein
MRALIILAVASLAQYGVLQLHKIGAVHAPIVIACSLLVYFSVSFAIGKREDRRIRLASAFGGAFACALIAPLIYMALEWREVPIHVENSFSQGGVAYFLLVGLFSGGWIYSILLLLSFFGKVRIFPK